MKSKPKYNDLAIVIAFPDNWAKGEKLRDRLLRSLKITYTQYYKVGHAALLLIRRKTGEIEYFDYGRYIAPQGFGRVRGKETDPKLSIPVKAHFTREGSLDNIREIIRYLGAIADDTHGHGRTFFSICNHIDFDKGKAYIQHLINKTPIPYVTYGIGGMNCSSFVSRAIVKATGSRKKKIRLTLPATIAPTPLGNVVNASDKGVIWEYTDGRFVRYEMNRRKVLKDLLHNISLSLYRNKHHLNSINKHSLFNRHEKQEIPASAQHLSCLGESAWVHIYKNAFCSENEYVIESYTDERKLNFSVLCETKDEGFDVNESYHFTYHCTRLKSIIVQKEKAFHFHFKRDLPFHKRANTTGNNKRLLSTNKS